MTVSGRRDPDTARELYPVEITFIVEGQILPSFVACTSWDAALDYLASREFGSLRARVRQVTISAHEDAR